VQNKIGSEPLMRYLQKCPGKFRMSLVEIPSNKEIKCVKMSMSDQKWLLATVTNHPTATVGGREGAGNSLAWCPGADRLSCFPSHARRSHRVPPPAMSTDCPEMARGLRVGGEQCWGRPPISPLSPLPAIRLLSRQVYLSVK